MKTKLITAGVFCAFISVGQNNMEIKEVSAPITSENTQTVQQEEIYNIVDEMPEFPGGTMEMMKFIQKNIKYPNSAKDKGTGGKVYIKFTVNADGAISDVNIIKGAPTCPECDEEGIRVVKLMPKWTPGKVTGKAVPVYYNLPINFEMKKR